MYLDGYFFIFFLIILEFLFIIWSFVVVLELCGIVVRRKLYSISLFLVEVGLEDLVVEILLCFNFSFVVELFSDFGLIGVFLFFLLYLK